jgi:putative endonuclease
MFTVYVLYSKTYKKIYIGFTSDIAKRFLSHNELAKKGWTVRFRPWQILHTETFDSKYEAMSREKELKGAKGREWIWNLVKEKYQ